jgi:hypothetical protein
VDDSSEPELFASKFYKINSRKIKICADVKLIFDVGIENLEELTTYSFPDNVHSCTNLLKLKILPSDNNELFHKYMISLRDLPQSLTCLILHNWTDTRFEFHPKNDNCTNYRYLNDRWYAAGDTYCEFHSLEQDSLEQEGECTCELLFT